MKQIALIYDFDGTLSPRNMQEFDFLRDVGIDDPAAFWRECETLRRSQDANSVLCYMRLMLEKSRAAGRSVSREAFRAYGAGIRLFEGVEEWFEKINRYGAARGLEIHHYINSSGMTEMIEGTGIAGQFSGIYASRFMYDVDGVAVWPATAIDFTAKTQVLWMINKGVAAIADADKVNGPMAEAERPVPFDHMLYFGDGETDVPSMQIVRKFGGHSFAVYNPDDKKKRRFAEQLRDEERVGYALPADYREGGALYRTVTALLDQYQES